MRPLIHTIVIAIGFVVAYKLRLITDLIPGLQLTIPPIDVPDLSLFAGVAMLFFVVWWFVKRLYGLTGPVFVQYRVLLKVRLYRSVSISFLAYFGSDYLFVNGISRLIVVWVIVLVACLLFVVDSLRYMIVRQYERRHPSRALYVYYDQDVFKDLVQKLHRYGRFETIGIHYDTFDERSLDGIKVVVMVWDYSKQQLQDAFERVRLAHKSFYHIADTLFLDDVVYKPRNIGGIVAMEYKASRLGEWERVFKRLFDVAVSFVALILLSPVFALLACLIKRDSPWPVFYKQQRVGRWWTLFTFVKFRSMYVEDCVGEHYGGQKAWDKRQKLINSDKNVRKGELQKIEDDPRVTKIGKFLRKTSLDELPNLLSVLWWSMSLVWPRPHMAHEIAVYKAWHKRLLSIKPGITWYAQIYGRDSLPFDEEARLDLLYIQNWTVFLDLMIIRKTFAVIAKGR